ncbi:hypothetical protein G7Y79_00028g062980 [Physcia stellaris]|nr:hypothetical protein G7Y79_00028g062980 [Physcia stellaris]
MTMAVSIEETCRKLDTMTNALKITMAEQEAIARKDYHRECDIFMPSLFVSDKYPEEDVMYKEDIAIYRDANRFINNLKIKHWFFDLMKKLQNQIALNLDILCNRLDQKYEQEWRSMRDQQQQKKQRIKQETEEARIAKERAEAFACRRCPAKFPSNTKLHQHIQDHHQKPAKPAGEIAKPTPSEPAKMTTADLTPPQNLLHRSKPTSDTSLPLTPPATPMASKPSTPASPATPRNQLSWAEIASRPVIAPKPSRLPIPTPKRLPSIAETAPITCPPTPQPAPKHQKPYLTIEDLFEMFGGKPKRTDLFHTKHHTRNDAHSRAISPSSYSYQAKITAYFSPAANQGIRISQGSKTPNPRSFQQHTPAESNRTKSTPSKWSEKSAISPYKTSTFSRLPTSEISSILPYKMPVISGRLHRSPTQAPSGISAFRIPAASAAVLSDRTMACIGT